MKWSNKGKEFDIAASEIEEKFGAYTDFYIFGAGKLGKELSVLLKKYNCLSGFVDNNRKKQGTNYCGRKVISLDDYVDLAGKKCRIVAVSISNMEAIKEQLDQKGLQYQSCFWTYREFLDEIFPIFSLYHYSKSFVALSQISLTERCTLKCKKCAHGCFAVSASSEDLSLNDAFLSADKFFEKVDYVNEFVLIGGEPLLYKELGKVIEYIGVRYRTQINIYSITTNGMILPSEEILQQCKKFGVIFRISNYSLTLPKLKKHYNRLTKLLEEYGIEFYLGPEESHWLDYGFEHNTRGLEPAQLMDVFDACRTPCREVRGNRLYFCVMARSVSDNLHYNVGLDDYLNLDELQGLDGKKILLEYTLGYSEKGYLDMCNYCNGKDAVNYPVAVAEQSDGAERK